MIVRVKIMVVTIETFAIGISWVITMIGNDLKGVVDELRLAVTVDLVAGATATAAIAVDPGHRVAAIVAHLVEVGVIAPIYPLGVSQRVQADPEVVVSQRVQVNPEVVAIVEVTVRRMT